MATIPASDRSITYNPVSATGPFPVPFPLFDESGADLLVTLDGVEVFGWQYSGTLESGFYGAPNTWVDGSILFGQAITGELTIDGMRSPRRQDQFQEGRGVPARDLDTSFNTLTAVDQELRRDINKFLGPSGLILNRLMRVRRGEILSEMPPVSDRADKWGGYNSSGQPIALNAPTVTVHDGVADFGTAIAAIATVLPGPQTFLRTAGYYNPGDGGGALYRKVASNPAHSGKIQTADGSWWELAEGQPITVRMFGVSGTGDESAGFNNAIAYCAKKRIRELVLPVGNYLAPSLNNPNGVKLVGDGVLRIDNVRYNSTADYYEQWVDGLEYLWCAHTILTTPGSLHKTKIRGDSTARGAYIGLPGSTLPSSALPENILYRLGIEHGAAWHVVDNEAVDGTTVADLNTATLTGDATVNTAIIKYMINDASFPPSGDAVETYATNLRAKLAAIRAVRPVGTLSIILVSGSSANSGGATPERGNEWFEKSVPVLRRAARDFQCVFVDVYSMLRDNKNAAEWMDTTDGVAQHTHPGEIMQHWIWGRVADILFNRNVMNRFSRPQTVALSNGWSTYSGYAPVRLSRAGGVVHIDGVIGSGTTADGVVLFTLPFGSWPTEDLLFGALKSSGSHAVLKVSSTTGEVSILTSGSGAAWLTLAGISFRVG